ncbi:hypothetical protein NVS55_39035 [Myxococcus stipitatus]|uniref:imm11 family protein n=1 Tax=Myxococcus stipitatus TaxID=83455 RepID=UPI003145439D
MNYFVLKTQATSDGGLIELYPSKSPADYRFDRGESLIREFPRGASVGFSDNFPEARRLYDFQTNTLSALIVSGRVRKLLESLEITNAEYLPVAVKNHQDEVVAEDYAIVNLVGAEDAIDMDKGVYRMNALKKDQIGRINSLAIKESDIRPEAKMFRCTMMRRLILIREDVHEAFKREGLTGFKVYKAEGWDGLAL